MLHNRWRLSHVLLNCGIVLSMVGVVLGWWWSTQPIALDEIRPALKNDPVQVLDRTKPFTFEYEGRDYEVEPIAKYSIAGLVVSHNDISSIADIYHNSRSVDVRDMCLIWGDNVATDVFHKMKFWSEAWTCIAEYRREQREDFNPHQLSNNHILTPDLELRDLLYTVNPGDQIEMKGLLVNYYHAGHPESARKTSLTRKDTGNGACEVFYVTDLGILKRGNWSGHLIYFWSVVTLIGLVCSKIVLHFITPLYVTISRR